MTDTKLRVTEYYPFVWIKAYRKFLLEFRRIKFSDKLIDTISNSPRDMNIHTTIYYFTVKCECILHNMCNIAL